MWDNRDYSVRLAEDAVRGYERVMLTSGRCGLFMPMDFLKSVDGEIARYDCSGFAPLSSYRIERTDDALYLLESALLILARSAEYLIMPARVTLTVDTVFYNKETGQVKIAYIPCGGKNGDLRKNLVGFIGQLKAELRDGHGEYLIQTAKYIYYHNYHIRDIINKVGAFRRELYGKETEKRGMI